MPAGQIGEAGVVVVGVGVARIALGGAALAGDGVGKALAQPVAGAARIVHHHLHAVDHRLPRGRLADQGRALRRIGQPLLGCPHRGLRGQHQPRRMRHAVSGQRGQCMRELQRRHRPVALADAGDHRLAGVPRLPEVFGLPCDRGQHAAGLVVEVDAGGLAEAELAHPRAEAVDAHVHRQLVEIGVHRPHDGHAQVDRAETAAAVVAAAERGSRQAPGAGGKHGVRRCPQAHFQPAQRHEGLHRGTGRVHPAQRAVEQRLVRRAGQRVVVGMADAVHEQVGIEGRLADHRQHLTVARIDRHRRTRLAAERLFGGLLDARVDTQVEILAGRRRMRLQHALGAAIGVHLDQLVTRRAVQHVLVGALDAGAADMGGALVARGIEMLQIVRVDARNVADHVREQPAHRITAIEVGHHVHAGEAPAVHRETVDLVLGEAHLQRHALEAAALLELLVEGVEVVLTERDHLLQPHQHRLHVRDLLGHHFQPERGHVVRKQHAVAVVDQATRGGNRYRLDPVVLRARGEFVVTRHLQGQVASEQAKQAEHDHREARQRTPAEQLALAA